MSNLATLEIAILKEFNGFRIIRKSDSTFMKLLDLGLKLLTAWQAREFMVSFVTTVGEVVYVPEKWDRWSDKSKMAVLRHERVHMRQGRRYTRVLYTILYLFVPLPFLCAYFRAKFEREAYEESMRARAEFLGPDAIRDGHYRESVIRHFTSAEYLWMWPWRKSVERWYDQTADKLSPRS